MLKSLDNYYKPITGLLLAIFFTVASSGAWAADPYVRSNTITVGGGPTDVVFNPAGTKAYTTNYNDDTVTEIDVATGSTTSITVGNMPTSIAIDPTGTFAYVTNYNNGSASTVSKIVLSTRTVSSISGVTGPRSVVFATTGNRAYVSNQSSAVSNTVSVINTLTDALIPAEAIAVGTQPQDMAISQDDKHLYVSRPNGGEVVFVDLTIKTSPVVSAPITGLTMPQGLALVSGGTILAVPERTAVGTVRFYDATTGSALSTVNGLNTPQTVTLSPSGNELYVANRGAANVRIIDLTSVSPTLLSTILPVGTTPFQVRFSPDGTQAYVANNGSASVSIISYYQARTLSFSTTSYTLAFGATQTVTATPSGGVGTGTITYSAGSSTACSVGASTGLVTMTAATGTCSITSSITAGALNTANTWAAASTTTPVTITPQTATLGVTAGSGTIAVGQSFTPSFTPSGLVSPNTIASVTFTYAGTGSTTYGPSTTRPTNVGTYSVTPSAAVFSNGSASNYTITYNPGTLTIQTGAVTLTAGSQTLSYGATQSPSVSITSGSLVSPDVISSVTYSYAGTGSTTYGPSTTRPTNAGTYSVMPSAAVVSPGSASNYSFTYDPGVLTVQQVGITVTAGTLSQAAGSTVTPSASLTTGSLVSPDAISGYTYTYAGTGSTTYGPSTTAPSTAGTYSITPSAAVFSTGTAANYSITYAPGSLTLIASAVSITLTAGSQTIGYGAAQSPSVSVTSGALVSPDAVTGVTYTYAGTGSTTYGPSTTRPTNVGTYSVTPSAAVMSNTSGTTYTVGYASGTLTIQTAAVTLTAGSQSINFGSGQTVSYSITSGSLITPDAISGVTYTYVGTGSTTYGPSTTAPTAAGTYSITPSAAVFSTGSASNYVITYDPGTLTIQRIALTVTVVGQTQWAGTSVTPVTSITSGGLVGSDAISGYTVTYSGTGSTSYGPSTTSPSNVGTYAMAPSTAVFSSGTASNYTITYTAGTLNLVAPIVPITLTAGSAVLPFGSTPNPSFTITSGSLAGTDAIGSVTYTYSGTGGTSYGPSTTSPTNPGTYLVTPSAAVFSSGNSANYNITYVAGTITISPSGATTVNLTLTASIGAPVAGSYADVAASGLATSAPYTLTVQSVVRIIATGSTSSGAANISAPLPNDLEPGWHKLTFTSTSPTGSIVSSSLYFEVSAAGTLLATSSISPGELPDTGFYLNNYGLYGFISAVLGIYFVGVRRPKVT